MKLKLFPLIITTLLLAACASPPTSVPPSPVAFKTPTPQTLEDQLIRQVQDDLAIYPRPTRCREAMIDWSNWNTYQQGVADSLKKLFADPRVQSLADETLAQIFKSGSGLTVDIYPGAGDAVLVSILDVYCHVRIGGGGSPCAGRDAVYVLNRSGGLWSMKRIENVLQVIWANNQWIVLVYDIQWGSGESFAVWRVRQAADHWKLEDEFTFGQLYRWPMPHLSADGNTLTTYSYDWSAPADCQFPDGPRTPEPSGKYSDVAWDYQWKSGQYTCQALRPDTVTWPPPTPTPRPASIYNVQGLSCSP